MKRVRVRIEEVDGLAVVRGQFAHGIARSAGIRPVYNGVRKGWVFDQRKIANLAAFLEYRGIGYEVISAGSSDGDLDREGAEDRGPRSAEDRDLIDLIGGDAE